VIVEGDSEIEFVPKLMALHVPARRVAVIRAGGDGAKNTIHILTE